MNKQYVEQRDDGYWLMGRRISLDSIVYAYLSGQTAESIAQSFPLLTIEEVYGAIAFYLANRAAIDGYLTEAKNDYDAKRRAARESDPMFFQKMADARRQGVARAAMRIRYQADADLNQIILLATIRREPSMDFQTAGAAGLPSIDDPQVLAIAAAQGRVLVTHDHRTMPRHFGNFIAGKTSSGVLVVPQHLSIDAAVEDLLLIWSASEAEEWINRICFLPL